MGNQLEEVDAHCKLQGFPKIVSVQALRVTSILIGFTNSFFYCSLTAGVPIQCDKIRYRVFKKIGTVFILHISQQPSIGFSNRFLLLTDSPCADPM